MNRFLWIWFFISAGQLCAQRVIDVSGTWEGTLSVLNSSSLLKLVIHQNEEKLTGYVYTKSLDEKDSTKERFTGDIEGNKLSIVEVETIYKIGPGCLSRLDLAFSQTERKKLLTGKWRGDLSFKTCPPGTSGPVNLFQEKEIQPIQTIVKKPSVSSGQYDGIGSTLISELGNREYYGLIIGIDQYDDPQIQTLDNPVNDSKALYHVLNTYYSFTSQNLQLLENPTRAEIIDALDQLSQKITETDHVLIFYAGHGIWNEQLNQGYWLPADASLETKSAWLSNSTIRDYLGGIKSKHTLLISDACFSGGILKERGVESSKVILELYKMPSRKAMTSGTMTTVPDNSVFIHYLLKNLEYNEARLLSADHLFRNLKQAVIHNSPTGQVPQYGVIAFTGDEGGDFIFLKKE